MQIDGDIYGWALVICLFVLPPIMVLIEDVTGLNKSNSYSPEKREQERERLKAEEARKKAREQAGQSK